MPFSPPIHADRILAISDIHVNREHNRTLVESWSPLRYSDDVLILAGDISDDLCLLKDTLTCLSEKFRAVFFVPGNHDVWIRSDEEGMDSLEKFCNVLSVCDRVGVHYTPHKIVSGSKSAWIVPLFSWYSEPEEDPTNTLFIAPANAAPKETSTEAKPASTEYQIWMDSHLCKWDTLPAGCTPSQYFTQNNQSAVTYDAPVISFSHFLPRKDLIRASTEEMNETLDERRRRGLGPLPERQGGAKGFNFTRFAGCSRIEKQIRELGSTLHVHGHQHRNRDRTVNGVRYVSHCMGTKYEQTEGWVWGLEKWHYGPRHIWP
ncbi:hypothetical protein CAPTEDRAFT_219491 [Capitella teleta]|uniref:Calcineurin-like phosphoesterase domain-containing protein n=1 Tax=Capitella teleta TaxID=283909 RepID=X2APN0_CAPTE|nr:hypothetical protein CAPTEDRAFT_219491 [Capitella teleta]|eukprot:ELU10139.1 hypothetical protein CAPTEDRAFT_219491 [Capitella teleta]